MELTIYLQIKSKRRYNSYGNNNYIITTEKPHYNYIYINTLKAFSKINNMLPFQAGFNKNYGTSDHIFNLLNLTKKYIKEIYINSCFVDFQNSYDSVYKENPV